MIEVKDLVKIYGDHTAVDHLSFTLEDGKIYGFLGPNGAGKSTTMNMMTGYISSTSGTVVIDGHDIYEESEEAKACIGYLPEIPPLYMELTVEEYLEVVARLKKVPQKEITAQVESAMERVMITHMRKRLIRNLSKGYRQRTGIAQALLGSPKIIILDEPTVGLDPQQIIEIRQLVKSLGETHTVIISSHILSEIQAICDHCLIINKGKLIASDSTANLSRMLVGGNALSLILQGEETFACKVLEGVSGVEACETAPGEEPGTIRVQLQIKEGMDIRRAVFYALSQADLPILEMRGGSMTLEEVFLSLTAADDNTRKGGQA